MPRKPLLGVLLAGLMLTSGCVGSGAVPWLGDDSEGQPATEPSAAGADPGKPPQDASAEGGFSDTHVFPGDYETGGEHARVLQEGPHEVAGYETHEIQSTVDGASIWMGIVRPDIPDGTQVPTILLASPYFQALPAFTFQAPDPGTLVDRDERSHFHVDMLVDNYVPHGYAVALVSLRGTGESGGCWDTLGPKTGADLDRTASWLANRSWSNGNVGAFGISQDGAAAWQLAATGNPHVETIVPAAGWPDHYGLVVRNGSISPRGLTFWTTVETGTRYTEPPDSVEGLETIASRAECPEAAEGAAATLYALEGGDDDPAGYWEARDHRARVLDNYDGSLFRIQGLDDAQIPPSPSQGLVDRLVDDEDVEVKQLLGLWGHRYPDQTNRNPTPRWDFAEVLLHWFDHWLKPDAERDLGPRVQVADQEGRWRSHDAWPPQGANRTLLYPSPNGTLAEAPAAETDEVPLGPHPGRLTRVEQTAANTTTPCPTCAVFETAPLDEPLRFAGAPEAHLTVTPTSPRGYLTADLYVVDANGSADHLTTTHMDLRYHQGGRQPETVTPGERILARMQLEPTDAVVPADGRLRLVVGQGSDGHSLFRTGGFWGSAPTQPPAPVLVHVGDDQSTLALDTFEPDPEAFFEPP